MRQVDSREWKLASVANVQFLTHENNVLIPKILAHPICRQEFYKWGDFKSLMVIGRPNVTICRAY